MTRGMRVRPWLAACFSGGEREVLQSEQSCAEKIGDLFRVGFGGGSFHDLAG